MDVKNDIWKELQDMHSPLAGASRVMPYPVPEGYFAAFAGDLLETMREELIGNKEEPYLLPENYFTDLPAQVLAAAQAEDSTAAMPKDNPYQLPPAYFDTLPAAVLQKARGSGSGRTISFNWSRAIQWAAAAIIVLGIALGSYRFLQPKPVNASKELAALPEETIQEYLVQNIDDFDSELIFDNLNTDKTIRSAAGLNDEDIIQYLNETGWNTQTEVN